MVEPLLLKVLLVIPTYNEAENIGELLERIWEHAPGTDVLFVDDNSPDGTWDRIESYRKRFPERVHLIQRARKLGLGTAYITGFRWALEHDYGVMVQMDADLSHDPADLPRLLELLEANDVVIGSRYVAGGGIRRWSVGRRLLSRFASAYARTILGLQIHDLTGGFNAWRRAVLETIDLATIRSEGYSFLIELKLRAHLAGASLRETPIVFVDRKAGRSKLSRQVILEAVFRVWLLRFGRRSLDARLKAGPVATSEPHDRGVETGDEVIVPRTVS